MKRLWKESSSGKWCGSSTVDVNPLNLASFSEKMHEFEKIGPRLEGARVLNATLGSATDNCN